MNYYQARQRESDKRWDFTVRNDDDIRAVGYCHPYESWSEEKAREFGVPFASQACARSASFAHRHHADGHETAEEATECYREYLLDHKAQYFQSYPNQQYPCKTCGKSTTYFATVDNQSWYLCADHNHSVEVRKLFKAPVQIASSY